MAVSSPLRAMLAVMGSSSASPALAFNASGVVLSAMLPVLVTLVRVTLMVSVISLSSSSTAVMVRTVWALVLPAFGITVSESVTPPESVQSAGTVSPLLQPVTVSVTTASAVNSAPETVTVNSAVRSATGSVAGASVNLLSASAVSVRAMLTLAVSSSTMAAPADFLALAIPIVPPPPRTAVSVMVKPSLSSSSVSWLAVMVISPLVSGAPMRSVPPVSAAAGASPPETPMS